MRTPTAQKLYLQLRTPTPPESPGGVPEPWVSKTPKQPIQAKGTQINMHKLTLVQSDVQLMRGELDTLSKRHRAKKKRLRQGGSMSVVEAQDTQAQGKANAMVKQKGNRVVLVSYLGGGLIEYVERALRGPMTQELVKLL